MEPGIAPAFCDSFKNVIDDKLALQNRARGPKSSMFETYVVAAPASGIQDGRLTIIFRNTTTDGRRLAGEFRVELRDIHLTRPHSLDADSLR